MSSERDIKEKITPIGRINFRNDNRIFGIKDSDRAHMWCVGKSGSGKSTLMLNIAISSIQNGKGIAILDPHSDAINELLYHVPEDRVEAVVYFSPADFPIAFNPLRHVHPEYRSIVASGLISTFKKLWGDFWGPRLEHHLRFCLLTLAEYGRASILDIQPLLTDPAYRAHVLEHITSPEILKFWREEYDKQTAALRAEAISPILNKVGIFATSPHLRAVMGSSKRGLDFSKIMDEGKIFLADLSIGRLGEDVSGLLGSLIISSFHIAALQRARQPEWTRRPYFLLIDEAHTFLTDSIADILSQARKYRLSLYMTHQYVSQLSDTVKNALVGNINTLISFRVGSADAKTLLAQEFQPEFTELDLINLPKFCMYLKLNIDGETSKPFSACSLPLSKRGPSFRNEVIKQCRITDDSRDEDPGKELKIRYDKPRNPNQTSMFENDGSEQRH